MQPNTLSLVQHTQTLLQPQVFSHNRTSFRAPAVSRPRPRAADSGVFHSRTYPPAPDSFSASSAPPRAAYSSPGTLRPRARCLARSSRAGAKTRRPAAPHSQNARGLVLCSKTETPAARRRSAATRATPMIAWGALGFGENHHPPHCTGSFFRENFLSVHRNFPFRHFTPQLFMHSPTPLPS